MRITWYFEHDTKLEKLNRGNAKLFWKEFFEEKNFQQGKTLFNSKVAYMNSEYFDNPLVSMHLEYERKNVLTYCLLGDPELDIYTNKPVKIMNPFNEEIYEGQNLSFTIRDKNNYSIPNARLSITSNDGLYHTFYTDNLGRINFIIPALGNKEYNLTVTGHNILPTQCNFKTLKDTTKPDIIDFQMIQNESIEIETICFKTEAYDIYSGIENVFILLSSNNFKDFLILPMERNTLDNIYSYELSIEKLQSGKYSYLALARDFANNTSVLYDESFNFKVIGGNQIEIRNFIVFLTFSILIGFIGISVILLYRKYQRKIPKKR